MSKNNMGKMKGKIHKRRNCKITKHKEMYKIKLKLKFEGK